MDDWRLTNQLSYMKGATLSHRAYTPHSPAWDHDHCELCYVKFLPQPGEESETAGYVTSDGYHWVCSRCFDDFRELFGWRVE